MYIYIIYAKGHFKEIEREWENERIIQENKRMMVKKYIYIKI